jgi:hypothetical protein
LPRRTHVVAEDLEGVVGGQARLVRLVADVGVHIAEPLDGGLELGPADVARAVDDLTVKVAGIDAVEVDETDAPHPRRGQVEPERRAEPAGPDEQDARRLELLLALEAHLGHDEVAAVARDLVAVEVHGSGLRHETQGYRMRQGPDRPSHGEDRSFAPVGTPPALSGASEGSGPYPRHPRHQPSRTAAGPREGTRDSPIVVICQF